MCKVMARPWVGVRVSVALPYNHSHIISPKNVFPAFACLRLKYFQLRLEAGQPEIRLCLQAIKSHGPMPIFPRFPVSAAVASDSSNA